MKTLIAGFGNVLLGDDGFGVEVVRRLATSDLPSSAETIEVGTGGFDFILRLMDHFDRAIIVDAVHRRRPAGTLYVFSPMEEEVRLGAGERVDPHFSEPTRAMKMARQLKLLPSRITVVGCEPKVVDLQIGLSEAVERAVGPAMEKVREIVRMA